MSRGARQARVVASNNYPMDVARGLIAEGRYPAHHLFGADLLEARGYDVRYLGAPSAPVPNAATRLTLGRWGDLGLQSAAWRLYGEATTHLAGEPHHVLGLAKLRAAGRSRVPIVAVVHRTPTGSGRMRSALSGFDRVLCLSPVVADEVRRICAGREAQVEFAPWGPDLGFPGYVSRGDDYVVSAGKTNRDVVTLFEALRRTAVPALVYSDSGRSEGAVRVVPPVVPDLADPRDSFGPVLEAMQRAAVVAIPLLDPGFASGLTEVNDALALGKPVVMTRTRHLGFDLEAEGVGLWVEAGDVDGWAASIDRLWNDSATRRVMGARARRFAESRWNARCFGERVAEAVEAVLSG